MNLCEYGCGQEAKHQFKNGRWCCSNSVNSCLNKRKKNLEFWSRLGIKEEQSNAMKEGWNRFGVKENQSRSMKEALSKPEAKEKRSKISKEVQNRLEVKEKQSKTQKEVQKEVQNRPGVKDKISRTNKETWKNKTNEEKEEHLSKIFKSNQRKPNKTELFIDSMIQGIKPNEFKYVGDGQIWIAGKNPDWFNINGRKQVIEYFSNYWHKQEDENIRKKHFKKYGFDCLIIWEDELKNRELLMQKIKNF
jgi:hypothetical protein